MSWSPGDVKARIESGERLWDDAWSAWAPTPDLLIAPTLPPGWEAVPAADRRDLDLLRR